MIRVEHINLKEDEILLLDGGCRPEVQEYVDEVKSVRAKVAAGMPEYLARLIALAERVMVLEFGRIYGKACTLCKNHQGQIIPLYKRGPKRGQRNPHKRIIQVPMAYSGDQVFCDKCFAVVLDAIKKMEHEPRYEIQVADVQSKAVRDYEMKCRVCGSVFWTTDVVRNNRFSGCLRKGCDGYLSQNGKCRVVEINALNVARILMED